MLNGILVIRKEQDYTSNDVVAKLRGICRQKKIGHTGTLDPNATGVLPVCLGNATKLCDMLTDRSKEYIAELTLGITTDTQDIWGQVLTDSGEKWRELSEEEIEKTVASFRGKQQQIPPLEILLWLLRGGVGGMGIVALQLVLSMMIRSFAVPIALALLGSVLGLMLSNGGMGLFWPYSLMTMGMNASRAENVVKNMAGFGASVSLFFLLFTAAGIRYLKKKDIVS